MPDSVKATLTFDESSQLDAFRYHMWHRYRIWLMLRTIISILLVLVGFILLLVHGPNPMPVLMLMVGTFALVRPMIWKIMHSRHLRKISGYGQKVTYCLTPQDIKIEGVDKSATVSWSSLFEVVFTQKGMLLYHGKKTYTWIPSASFDSLEAYQTVKVWADEQKV
ncbi:MAG: YcxB family protein [Akkermansiaceae bacterium]